MLLLKKYVHYADTIGGKETHLPETREKSIVQDLIREVEKAGSKVTTNFEATINDLAAILAQREQTRDTTPLIIHVMGFSGTGKSTLSEALALYLNQRGMDVHVHVTTGLPQIGDQLVSDNVKIIHHRGFSYDDLLLLLDRDPNSCLIATAANTYGFGSKRFAEEIMFHMERYQNETLTHRNLLYHAALFLLFNIPNVMELSLNALREDLVPYSTDLLRLRDIFESFPKNQQSSLSTKIIELFATDEFQNSVIPGTFDHYLGAIAEGIKSDYEPRFTILAEVSLEEAFTIHEAVAKIIRSPSLTKNSFATLTAKGGISCEDITYVVNKLDYEIRAKVDNHDLAKSPLFIFTVYDHRPTYPIFMQSMRVEALLQQKNIAYQIKYPHAIFEPDTNERVGLNWHIDSYDPVSTSFKKVL